MLAPAAFVSSVSNALSGNKSSEDCVRNQTRDQALGLARASACGSVSQPTGHTAGAGALPQTADVIGDAGTAADCVRVNVRF